MSTLRRIPPDLTPFQRLLLLAGHGAADTPGEVSSWVMGLTTAFALADRYPTVAARMRRAAKEAGRAPLPDETDALVAVWHELMTESTP